MEREIKERENTIRSEDVFITKIKRPNESALIIITCYMTVEGNNEGHRENTSKYQYLNEICTQYRCEKILIIGDMNGHIGILNENINRNGEKLLQFTENQNMEIGPAYIF